jgi:hypothetical protein
MSLINDALKQAKQNQQTTPPAVPPLEFKPVEPGQQKSRQTSLLIVGLSLVIVAIIGLVAALAWFVSQKNSPVMMVQAATNRKPVAQTNPPPSKPVVVSDHSNESLVAETKPATVAETNTPLIEAVNAVVEAAKPAAPKLQGIFFNANNPSAVVNGRSVFLGERVGNFFVLGISPTTVTLANSSVTNVLSLSEP